MRYLINSDVHADRHGLEAVLGAACVDYDRVSGRNGTSRYNVAAYDGLCDALAITDIEIEGTALPIQIVQASASYGINKNRVSGVL